jgi:outer membrane receptor protein involved in Fe transport
MLQLKYNFSSALRPEKSQSIELGYKGLILPNLLVDVYGYSTQYKDFISSLALVRKENFTTGVGVPVAYSTTITLVLLESCKLWYGCKQPR